MTVQEKIAKLDDLVAWFEGDDFSVEQASIKLKEAAKLTDEIEHDLAKISNEIHEVKKKFDIEG